MAQVLVLATLATKADEAHYLTAQLEQAGVSARIVDLSLDTGGKTLGGDAKRDAMDRAATGVLSEVIDAAQQDTEVVIGIGGGTGGEIALQVLRALPITFPKVLVSTLPFDPRAALADNSIILVPTLADIFGLNAMLRDVLGNAALITAGLCRKAHKGEVIDFAPSVGITALGATDPAIKRLLEGLNAKGQETTVFHSNGYGGAAFSRFAERGAFKAIVDLTPHELTRIHVAGAHVPLETRFSAGSDLPRIVLPGALNFIGLGQKPTIPSAYLERPHYEHSGYFTHVKLIPSEMEGVATKLAEHLNALTGPCAVIVPMGGFSHHDRPGGLIEDPGLREVFRDTLRANLASKIPVTVMPEHLFDPAVTSEILTTYDRLTA